MSMFKNGKFNLYVAYLMAFNCLMHLVDGDWIWAIIDALLVAINFWWYMTALPENTEKVKVLFKNLTTIEKD